ncbi:MAG TPA: glycosyltransferase family 2 protein [Candidatus Nanoarchaeia archaeon]|nr:glycosyltransferase family 2 protein [Candidatus Nanoarchaeia archaeon]
MAAAGKESPKADFYVIIPAHNEHAHIGAVLEKAKRFAEAGKIIVVDDGSRDGTATEAKKHGVAVLRQVINLGKGAALRTGALYARRKGADALVFMDSDGQHEPADIPRLVAALEGNDIVFTYRTMRSSSMPLVKKFGNTFIDAMMRLLFRINIKDTQCGYKAMTMKAYEKLRLISNDYSMESEIVAKTGKNRLKFTQVPIATIYQDRYKGTTVFDGVNIVMKMIWWKIAR